MMRIEEFVDSMKPRNAKERKKLLSILKGVSVTSEGDHYAVRVPKDFMGIPYDGHIYYISTLVYATPLKVYEKSLRRYVVYTEDEYGKKWLRIAHNESAYDDYQQVFFPVKDEYEAEKIYDIVGTNTMTYFWPGDYDDMVIPHFRANESPYMHLAVSKLPMRKDEMFAYVVENNVIF